MIKFIEFIMNLIHYGFTATVLGTSMGILTFFLVGGFIPELRSVEVFVMFVVGFNVLVRLLFLLFE